MFLFTGCTEVSYNVWASYSIPVSRRWSHILDSLLLLCSYQPEQVSCISEIMSLFSTADLQVFPLCFRKRRYLFVIFFFVNIIFLTLNVADAVLVNYKPCCRAKIVLARVIVNESLFVFTSFALCYCIIKVSLFCT
jgi:succinate-acetate transporter protein